MFSRVYSDKLSVTRTEVRFNQHAKATLIHLLMLSRYLSIISPFGKIGGAIRINDPNKCLIKLPFLIKVAPFMVVEHGNDDNVRKVWELNHYCITSLIYVDYRYL